MTNASPLHANEMQNNIAKRHHKELLAIKQLLSQLEEQAWHLHEHLHLLTGSMTKEEIKLLLDELQLSDSNIRLLEIIAHGKEDHSVHAAIKEIKKERKLHSLDDPADHLNYTAI